MFKRPSTLVAAKTGTLAISSLLVLAACGNGSGSGTPQPAEEALQEIAAQADHPVYYLGQQYRDWIVSDTSVDNDTGRIYVFYGTCSAVVDSCAPPFQVMTEVMDPELWSAAVGCSRLPPVRGVPAVSFGDALMLLTADSLITLADDTGDAAAATAAAEQLRPVGAALSTGALPPPDPAALQIVETACGKNPGDIGPTEPEQGPAPTGPPQVPDFTVDQLGGGVLRWSAYRGKPVVVVVGDVPDVIQGIRRVTELRAGPRPAVIGLVWKVFGSKFTPAPIAAIATGGRRRVRTGGLCGDPPAGRLVLRHGRGRFGRIRRDRLRQRRGPPHPPPPHGRQQQRHRHRSRRHRALTGHSTKAATCSTLRNTDAKSSPQLHCHLAPNAGLGRPSPLDSPRHAYVDPTRRPDSDQPPWRPFTHEAHPPVRQGFRKARSWRESSCGPTRRCRHCGRGRRSCPPARASPAR